MKQLALALSLALGFAAPAGAQTPDDVARSKALFRAGASAYAAGDYASATRALAAAYELTPLPAIGFSLAQAERKRYLASGDAEHLERAIALFRRYLEEAPSGNRRGDAHDALTELVPLLASQTPSARAEGPSARPTRLIVVAEAPAARISLDGNPDEPSPLIREVAPGKHHVRVSAPGFAPLERNTTAIPGEVVLNELTLNELPSRVTLHTPPETHIYVDGRFAGESEGRLTLELPAGEHRLAASLKGHRAEYHRVRLARGQALALRVTPEQSTQRVVSQVLFSASGAAIGAGIVLAALAVHSENDAEDFLAARAHGSVDGSDLIGYHASLSQRDRLRVAAGVSFASAVGLVVTGLFLHELDRPIPEDPRPAGPGRQGQRGRRPMLSRWTFTPSASADGGSASLRFVF